MRFVHLSSKAYTKFIAPKDLGTSFKPKGTLWVACDTEWKDWLKSQEMEIPKYEYTVELDKEKLLVLRTEADIKSFSERFSIPDKEYPYFEIDWNKVRNETGKSGILVEDAKIESARAAYAWYASFDICSAAIWKEDAIKRVTGKGRQKTRRRAKKSRKC
jgi:hypothetical protein